MSCPYEHWVMTGKLIQGVPCSDKCAHWIERHSRRPMNMAPCSECHRLAKTQWAIARGEATQ